MDEELFEIGLAGVGIIVGLIVLRIILRHCVPILNWLYYAFFRVLSFFFSFLNGLQRHLSKPWRQLYKNHHGSDGFNKFMRVFWFLLKIPLYIVLTPLRFVNAFFYNIVVHSSFEFFNYLSEIIDPTSSKEGGANFITWLLLLPLRIVKYGWHYLLSLVESFIWTAIDTVVPALTLYHGTSQNASVSICESPGRIGAKDWFSGVWNVGSGNYAGNGIYFAPIRSTAKHYSSGALIICRVSLGKVIDIGMAPKYVFNQCGYPNALGATKWGLDHGYKTGEWWRPLKNKNGNWWEYCMYDWENRYNSSWRIRPIYVEDLNKKHVLRIPGGMAHWFFRGLVIKDIFGSIFGGNH